MKIILIQAPPRGKEPRDHIVPPLGLAYLASSLEKKGIEAQILDAYAEGLTLSEFEGRVKASGAQIIGFTGMSPVIDTTFKAIRIVRPYAKYIILGGPHASAYKERVFEQCPELDIAIYGEGEETLPELVSGLEKGKSLEGMPGVITRQGKGPPRRPVKDLDSLPFPARHLLPNRLYRYPLSPGRRVTTMIATRGCPFSCTFCDNSVFGHLYRARSPENVVEEMGQAVNRYGAQTIIFYDDLFTVKKPWVLSFCKEIAKRKLKVDWKCESRVDIIDEEMLVAMKEAGCTLIAYGVESGNQKTLDYFQKKVTIDDARRAFGLTKKARIQPMAYFILGAPVETWEDSLRSIAFAIELDPAYVQFSILSPTYGTRAYEEAKAHGWLAEVDARNPYDRDLKRPVMLSPNWDEKKLNRIVKIAYRRFYLRPRYILRTLSSLKTLGGLRSIFTTGLRLLRWMAG